MARDISIAITAKDRYSDAITTMRNSNNAFNKDLTGTITKLEALEKTQLHLKRETKELGKALQEAEKRFAETGDAADKMAMELANANYKNAQHNLDLVSKNARQAEKDILSMTSAVSKAENRAGSSGGGQQNGMFSTLANAGLFKMVGDSAAGMAGMAINSALGSMAGSAVQDILSGAASGAALGSIIPGVGTAIGAGVGALSGGINAAVSSFSTKDEAFKGTVQERYNATQQEQQNTLSRGVGISGTREQTQLAFAQRFGSDEAATEYLEKTKTMAKETNYSFDEITGYSKSLLNSYKPDEVFGILNTLSDASAGLDLGASDVNMFISGLSRMRTTGKATQEYLNYFSERGVDVYKALGDDIGVNKSQVADMVTKGKVSGDTAAQAILDYIDKTYGGLSQKLATTYNAMVDNLQDSQDEIDAAMGEGYMEERKKGIQAAIDDTEGIAGERAKEANRLIGQYQASLENAREEALRNARDTAMSTDEYKKAEMEGDALTMGRILAEARAKGENEYMASDGYQAMQSSNLTMIQNIREDTALKDEYWNTGLVMAQEFSKGFASVTANAVQNALTPGSRSSSLVGDASEDTETAKSMFAISQALLGGSKAPGKAFGMNYVPYDNFPALLHQGERVLTASEARATANPSSVNVNITGPITVRNDGDVEAVGNMVVSKIIQALEITV